MNPISIRWLRWSEREREREGRWRHALRDMPVRIQDEQRTFDLTQLEDGTWLGVGDFAKIDPGRSFNAGQTKVNWKKRSMSEPEQIESILHDTCHHRRDVQEMEVGPSWTPQDDWRDRHPICEWRTAFRSLAESSLAAREIDTRSSGRGNEETRTNRPAARMENMPKRDPQTKFDLEERPTLVSFHWRKQSSLHRKQRTIKVELNGQRPLSFQVFQAFHQTMLHFLGQLLEKVQLHLAFLGSC